MASLSIVRFCNFPRFQMLKALTFLTSIVSISSFAIFGVANSQHYSFFRLCSSKEFFKAQLVSLIGLLKKKSSSSKYFYLNQMFCLMKKDLCLAFLPLKSSKWSFQWLSNPKWGVFLSPNLSSKVPAVKDHHIVCLSSFWVFYLLQFYFSLCFLVPLSSWIFWMQCILGTDSHVLFWRDF